MKKTDPKTIRSLDEFDETVSLWQLLARSGSGLEQLKAITDAELNSPIDRGHKPLSVLITGAIGKKTHARAFLRALGVEQIKEVAANLLLSPTCMIEYFCRCSPDDGYLISEAEGIWGYNRVNIYQIVRSGEFLIFNQSRQCSERHPVYGVLVLTAQKEDSVPASISRCIEHHIQLGEFSHEGILLATLQRIKYANLSYESEQVLQDLVEYADGNLNRIVELLKLCILLLRGQNENHLTLDIVKKAAKLIG